MISLLVALLLGGTVERCALEDGSTQAVCIWDGSRDGNGRGDVVLNLDYGRVWITLDSREAM